MAYTDPIPDDVLLALAAQPVSAELISEVARRTVAKYFDFGILPKYLDCVDSPEVAATPAGKLFLCIRDAFIDFIRHPLDPADAEDHPEIPLGDYCYFTKQTETGLEIDKPCPWHGIDPHFPERQNGFCRYTGKKDWDDDNPFNLLWDSVKSCGVNKKF